MKHRFKSRIVPERKKRKTESALEMAKDLCGCVRSSLRGLSHDKKYLRGFGSKRG